MPSRKNILGSYILCRKCGAVGVTLVLIADQHGDYYVCENKEACLQRQIKQGGRTNGKSVRQL